MSSSNIEVLVIVRVADEALSQIAAVDSCLHVVDGRGWFEVNIMRAGRRGACGATSARVQSRSARARRATGC